MVGWIEFLSSLSFFTHIFTLSFSYLLRHISQRDITQNKQTNRFLHKSLMQLVSRNRSNLKLRKVRRPCKKAGKLVSTSFNVSHSNTDFPFFGICSFSYSLLFQSITYSRTPSNNSRRILSSTPFRLVHHYILCKLGYVHQNNQVQKENDVIAELKELIKIEKFRKLIAKPEELCILADRHGLFCV